MPGYTLSQTNGRAATLACIWLIVPAVATTRAPNRSASSFGSFTVLEERCGIGAAPRDALKPRQGSHYDKAGEGTGGQRYREGSFGGGGGQDVGGRVGQHGGDHRHHARDGEKQLEPPAPQALPRTAKRAATGTLVRTVTATGRGSWRDGG